MLLITVALLGCKHTSGEQPDQLEAPEAIYEGPDAKKDGSIVGDATVSGGDRDWSVTVDDGAATHAVDFHVPGASDLSVLDGASVTISLFGAWEQETRTVRIDDETGPRFFVQIFEGGGPATDLFGADFASFGDEVGTGTMEDDYGTWEVSYKKAVFATDDGAVEADPGEPFVATIDGVDWRVVVHASFEVTKTPDTLPGCGGGIGTTLSFEMLAVVTPPALDAVAPLAGARQSGHYSCGG